MTTKATITELEVLFTANTQQVDDAAKTVEERGKKIEKNPVKQKVDGDAKGALGAMDRVEAEAKKIVSAKTMATVDANIDRAESSLTKVQERLDYLRSVDGEMEVTADIKKAEAAIKQITRRRDALVSAKESMVVDADTSPAEAALDGLADDAGAAGAEGGDAAGEGLGDGIIEALKAIPVAGGIILAGVAIGKAFTSAIRDGLDVELREDELAARTGLDAETVAKIGRAAGEAYASNWGESIRDNLTTAQSAIQGGLLDPNATKQATQNMIESLSGVSDIIGEEIPRVTRSTMQLLRTGLAKDSAEAFDIIVKGQQAGLNVSEDWLDTIDEYSTQWRKLGLDGGQVLGLLSQGVKAGARDTDLAADALKEFSIRAIDGSESTKAGFDAIGLSAKDMAEKIAAGGPGAAEALDLTLDKLRAIEDPAARSAAAVQLFGTQAEDLGDALYAMDLTTATDQLGTLAGTAKNAMDTLGDNTASSIESAQRNIELAADGIKGALAEAFGPQLDQAATWVQANRGPLMEFIAAVINGALDIGEGFINGLASATEGVGEFTAGPLADIVDGVASLLNGLDKIPGVDLGDAVDSLHGLSDQMRDADDAAAGVADTMRTNLIENGLDPARERMNGFLDPLIADAYVHDSLVATSAAIDTVGLSADGTSMSLDDMAVSADGSSTSNELLNEQLKTVSSGLAEQLLAAQNAGEGQDELVGRYNATRDALVNQLQQMGLTKEQAQLLADTYLSIPGSVNTNVTAETAAAEAVVTQFTEKQRRIVVQVGVKSDGTAVYSSDPTNRYVMRFEHDGDHLLPMASGGALTPMPALGAKVPPNTWRVVGDRMDVPEWYIPQDGSARSRGLALDAARAFGILPMATGGLINPSVQTVREGPMVQVNVERVVEGTPQDVGDEVGWALIRSGRGVK